MNEYHLKLPWPPTNNTLFSVVNGRKIKSKKGRAFTEAVINQITKANQQFNLSGKLKIKIVANPPDLRKRDLDNLLKAPLDALTQSGVIADDSMFRSMSIDFGEKVQGGSLDITIWEIEDAIA
ncbi:RusA family crossover junction endodeoxyribonuclease [Moellerella wisconsensis]|uniref:RusA family crossover junction endodeoxyribonuclease n=1 Tax=Moellerella wisconsensis TaxID=158849 RepID=UPI0025AF0ED3|nr:RusA family crossover junction endodeoxyribonuclease [Moellerella wisconsensis]WJW82901.1 RusA family crossover junction endodeoxyribonuclease [Moellerella wisconsensis]